MINYLIVWRIVCYNVQNQNQGCPQDDKILCAQGNTETDGYNRTPNICHTQTNLSLTLCFTHRLRTTDSTPSAKFSIYLCASYRVADGTRTFQWVHVPRHANNSGLNNYTAITFGSWQNQNTYSLRCLCKQSKLYRSLTKNCVLIFNKIKIAYIVQTCECSYGFEKLLHKLNLNSNFYVYNSIK